MDVLKTNDFNLLNKFKKNYHSQYGEDGIIEYLLNILSNIPKICCEFGAMDGKKLSNTYRLFNEKGFNAILLERDESYFTKLQKEFKNNEKVKMFNTEVNPSGPFSLDNIFKKNNLPMELGVLSIDIDSFDYWVFKQIEFIRSAIVIVEFNNSIPADIDYNDDENEVALRCSAKALERIGNEKGYKVVACTTTNVIFVHQNYIDKTVNERLPNLPIEAMFDYEGQRKNNTYPIFPVYSQMISSYPIFSTKPSKDIKLFIYIRQIFKSLIINSERFKKPSKQNCKNIKKSGMWI